MYLEHLHPPGVVTWTGELEVWMMTVVAVWVFVSEWHVIVQLDLYPAVCYVRAGTARPAKVSARQWQMYPKYSNKPYKGYRRYNRVSQRNAVMAANVLKNETWVCLCCSQVKVGGSVMVLIDHWLIMSIGWDYVSELRPPKGLLFIPYVMYEHGEPRWNDMDREKLLIRPAKPYSSKSGGSGRSKW
jgi:hypothetical protein